MHSLYFSVPTCSRYITIIEGDFDINKIHPVRQTGLELSICFSVGAVAFECRSSGDLIPVIHDYQVHPKMHTCSLRGRDYEICVQATFTRKLVPVKSKKAWLRATFPLPKQLTGTECRNEPRSSL